MYSKMAEQMVQRKMQEVTVISNENEKMALQKASKMPAEASQTLRATKKQPGKAACPTKSSVAGKDTAKETATCNAQASGSGTSSSNKEIGLILKELNTNILKQGEKIEKLSQRVDFLYETGVEDGCQYDYSQDWQEYEDGPVFQAEPVESDEEYDEPPPKKKATFKDLSSKFLFTDRVDCEINDQLADFVNSSFRNGIPEERVTELVNDIARPQNCESLVKTRVNSKMWNLLEEQTKMTDNKMQTIQNCLVKASINVVKILDKEGEGFDAQTLEWGTNTIALLGQSNKLLNNKRKEFHKYDLDPQYFPLTSPRLPYTEYLYGDDNDVNKNVKDINDMSRIGKIGRGRGRNRGRPYQYQRGNRGGYGTRRGRRPPYRRSSARASYAGPKNSKEGQRK